MTKISTLVFGGCSGVGRRCLMKRVLDLGLSGMTSIQSVGESEWALETKYFTARLIPITAQTPQDAGDALSGAGFEVFRDFRSPELCSLS